MISTVIIKYLRKSVTNKMSGYGRSRLLLSDSDSEGEKNSERRRHSNVTPYGRPPVQSTSN